MTESEERFASFMDHMPAAAFITDDARRMAYVNRYMKDVLAAESWLGRLPEDCLPPDIASAMADAHESALRGEHVVRELPLPVRNGERRIFQVHQFALPRPGKGPVVAGFALDVTDQRMAERALADSETRHRDLVRNANSVIMRIDPQGRVIFFNDYASDFFGFSEHEILGRCIIGTIIPPRDSSGNDLDALVHDVWRHPEAYPVYEYEGMKKDGERVWISWTHRASYDADGNIREILCIGNDVSQRKRAEHQQRRAAKEWRDTFDAIRDAVVIFDRTRRVVKANRAAFELFPGRAVIGDTCHDLYHGTDWPIDGCPACVTLETGDPAHTEIHDTRDGDRWLAVDTYPIRSETGRVTEIVHVTRDVTEQHTMAASLMLQERLAAVGQLAAGIAHDFNNILSVILGYSQLLQGRADLPEPDRTMLETIHQQGQRGASMIRRILDFSRRSISRPVALDLRPLLKEQVRLLQRVIAETVEITFKADADEFLVNADPTQVQQILTNMALNAQDAMPEGGTLSLELRRERFGPGSPRPFRQMPNGEWVVLTVADTGTGIDPKNLPHIFEPFFTTKDVGKGTGLGLAQVYGLVKQHGGFIDCKSQLGAGTTFTVYFPAAPNRSAEDESGSTVPPRGQGETVLLVEDEPAVLEVTRAMLKDLGYRVLAASDGLRALEMVESFGAKIDLVLSDLIMPNMSGLALVNTLKATQPDVRVVIMTGYPLEEKAREFLESGGARWLQKPVSTETLGHALAEVRRAR